MEREAATTAATALYADPRATIPPTELRAEWERQTGQSRTKRLIVNKLAASVVLCG